MFCLLYNKSAKWCDYKKIVLAIMFSLESKSKISYEILNGWICCIIQQESYETYMCNICSA